MTRTGRYVGLSWPSGPIKAKDLPQFAAKSMLGRDDARVEKKPGDASSAGPLALTRADAGLQDRAIPTTRIGRPAILKGKGQRKAGPFLHLLARSLLLAIFHTSHRLLGSGFSLKLAPPGHALGASEVKGVSASRSS
jgi:hypothetical protein